MNKIEHRKTENTATDQSKPVKTTPTERRKNRIEHPSNKHTVHSTAYICSRTVTVRRQTCTLELLPHLNLQTMDDSKKTVLCCLEKIEVTSSSGPTAIHYYHFKNLRMQANEESQRIVAIGKGSFKGTNNAIYTSKYNIFNFLPIVSSTTSSVIECHQSVMSNVSVI